ncbi:MAG: hypothetical protein ACXQS8_08750 [Candidatus Helarchaeales archaeon]
MQIKFNFHFEGEKVSKIFQLLRRLLMNRLAGDVSIRPIYLESGLLRGELQGDFPAEDLKKIIDECSFGDITIISNVEVVHVKKDLENKYNYWKSPFCSDQFKKFITELSRDWCIKNVEKK